MERFSEECLEVFLREQSQLFDEPVAEMPRRLFWRTVWQSYWIL